MISHLNLVSGQVALEHFGFEMTSKDIYFSFLPLSDVFEQAMHINCLLHGCMIGYSSGEAKQLQEDIEALEPTIISSSCDILNQLSYKIQKEYEQGFWPLRVLFERAIEAKIANFQKNGLLQHPLYDYLIFNSLK